MLFINDLCIFFDSKNDEYMTHAINNLKKKSQKLDIKKNFIFDEIDKVKEK